MLEGRGATRWRRQREKNWDNCNSIINKIYLKQEREKERGRINVKFSYNLGFNY